MVSLKSLAALLGFVQGINVFTQEMDGRLIDYQYLKVLNSNVDDEVVMAWTTRGGLYISHDQGQTWTTHNIGQVTRVIAHPFAPERAYVYADSRLYYTDNHGKSFQAVKVPGVPWMAGRAFDFNKKDPNYVILTTNGDCDALDPACPKTSWLSRNSGRTWTKILENVAECRFGSELATGPRDLVFCSQRDGDKTKLLSSLNYFKGSTTHFDSVVGFALDSPFLVVAAYDDNDNLLSYTTQDGSIFAPAHLPGDITVAHRMGYTVIDTSTKTLFLDVTSHTEYGSIVKSNANGTDFVQIVKAVNRSPHGYVDFEKVSIEGLAFANIVENYEDVANGGGKVFKSRVSHSDGAFWDPIPAPDDECGDADESECSLHLHGFTERFDARNSPDSPSAPGLVIGTGNVGDSLLPIKEGKTYMTRDAGITWKQIADEPMIWEYGDSGSIIVIARYGDVTDSVRYSFDEGDTWDEFKFSDEMVQILNIANIPSDTSRKFVIFARGPTNKGDKTVAYTIQFDSVRECGRSDLVEWTPVHPYKGDCLFGHTLVYTRKDPFKECSIGKKSNGNDPIGTPTLRKESCECTREDYECDYNHELTEEGECKLISGLTIPKKEEQCANGGIYWREITGYRRIAIDTCKGGKEMGPKQFYACPGKEDEFKRLFGDNGSTGGGGGVPGSSSTLTIAFFLFFLGASVAGVGLFIASYYEKSGHITLGDVGDDTYNAGPATRALNVVVGVGAVVVSQIKELADRLLGNVESRFASRRNVYSRLDDDERARILSEHLSDDELDNPELDNFNLYEDEE